MATNYVQEGDTLAYTNGTGSTIPSSQAVLVGTRLGVALGDIANGAIGALAVRKVFRLPKAAGAVTQGAALYWDATNKVVTTTSSGNTYCGWAFAAAASGDATVDVKLND